VIGVAVLMVFAFVAAPALCVLVTWETHRHATRSFREDMERRETDVSAREAAVAEREHEMLRVELTHGTIAERDRLLMERQLELRRQSHDAHALAWAAMNSISEDTEISLLDSWADLEDDE
jgi:hypothetical protein